MQKPAPLGDFSRFGEDFIDGASVDAAVSGRGQLFPQLVQGQLLLAAVAVAADKIADVIADTGVIALCLMLTGTEVKSLRTGKATIAESYASVDRAGEIFLVNANIPEYLQANRFNHEPKRPRKLLLKSREIAKLSQGT